jgi:hypothetical protein
MARRMNQPYSLGKISRVIGGLSQAVDISLSLQF